MKKLIAITAVLILLLASCLRKDVQEEKTVVQNSTAEIQSEVEYPPMSKTVTINGVDYLETQAGIGSFGGELISSTIGEGPKTFNPFTTKDATSDTMATLMYDGLVTSRADTGEVIPKLAKSFSISPDGKTYTVNLRKGITWSDGKPITAEDVVFTWDKIIFAGLGNTSTRDSVLIDNKLPTVKKIDDYTVQFITSKPFAPFLRTLSTPIAPKHVFEPAVNKGEKYFDAFLGTTTNPQEFVISGAFKLKEYVAAQRIVFERNPNYYVVNTKGETLPYLDKLVYLIVGDLNNEILKFEAGEIDVISLRGSTVGKYKEKEPRSDYVIYNIGADTGTMFVAVNMSHGKSKDGKFFVNPKKQLWFNDRNFRYAIDYAIDRDAIVNNIANGLGKPLFTAESLNSIYLNEKLAQGHKQDLNLAREYLRKSGFYLKNGELYDKFSNRVEFDLYTNAGNTEREAIGVMVKQDLETLGMKVNFKPIEF
ncbi:ABC transporter substrate-binding protein, partial [bacterium]|nr:ABC transporter substrate-binding protein [bacterium]